MGFHIQRRINLTRGLGFNLSKSGVSGSVRTKAGSIGSKGFSIRSGIPGFYYRGSWGGKKSGVGASIAATMFLFFSLMSACFLLLRLAFFLFIMLPINILSWLIPTICDYVVYLRNQRKEPVVYK
mgnify:CR=1 FL=1